LHTLTELIRLADEFQDVSFVRQPIQQSSGQSFIAENLGPVGEAQIGRYDYGRPRLPAPLR
jgi:hypothetical protein